jgi:hypothetical protein
VSFHKVGVGDKTVGIEILNEGGRVVAVRRALPGHMLKKPPAWSFSEEVIDFLQEKGVDEVRVICDGTVYTCTMADFLKLAVRFSRGFGQQRHLPLQYWQKRHLGEKESCQLF